MIRVSIFFFCKLLCLGFKPSVNLTQLRVPQPHCFRVQLATEPLLVALGLDLGVPLLRSNKTLNHWPFQKQAAKQPVVSPEVTDGETEK